MLNSISSNPKLDEEDKIHLEGELSDSENLTVLKKIKILNLQGVMDLQYNV